MAESSAKMHPDDGGNAKTKDHKKLMTSVARSASYNIALQLMFRVFTFVVNAIVLRYITKDLLGIVNVRLTLLYSTALFLGREAFRKACLTKLEEDVPWQEVINIAWCSPVCGALVSAVCSYVWLYHLQLPDNEHASSYSIGVVCFSLSAILEMVSEPMYIIGQKLFYVRFKAVLEGLALIVKCIITIALVTNYPHMGIPAFCIAHLSFTVIYTSGYFIYFGYLAASKTKDFPFTSIRELLPAVTGSGVLLNRELAGLAGSFLKQSFLKQLLTEGEKYVMTVFNVLSFADQGVFDVISNLGSLVARFLFLPIEDSSYLLFSQSITRGTPASKQDKETVHATTEVLIHLIKMLTVVGLTVLVFGYTYSELALHIYGGTILSVGAGPNLLRWYCVYVLLMAINGITECFAFATMSKTALDRYNYFLLCFSAAFLAASLLLTAWFGSAGFIMANCCNLAIRIVHSIYVVELFYTGTSAAPLKDALIDIRVLGMYIFIWLTLSMSEAWLGAYSLQLVCTGVILLGVLLYSLYRYERTTLTFIWQRFVKPLAGDKTD